MDGTGGRLGLGARLAIGFAVLAAVTALVTALVSASSTSRQVTGDIDRFLEERSLDIAEGRRADLGLGPGRRDRNGRGQQELVDSDAEVQVLDRVGGIVSATAGVELPVTETDLGLLRRGEDAPLRTIEIEGEAFRIITRHIDGGGAVQVARSLASTDALLGNLRRQVLLLGVLMSGVAALVGWGVAQGTTRPLRRLTKRVEHVATTEDLSTSVALDRTDEIGRLSQEFDSLLKNLNSSQEQQRRLIQDAAHELRTPLTSVRANIDFLEHAPDLHPDERQATLSSVKAELSELSAVLAEVVELAIEPPSSASFEQVDLAAVAEAALAQFELRSSRPVNRDLSPSIVAGDSAALVRAAANLLANADKYTEPDLPVTVAVRDGSLWVADHGPGISEEDREHVFDRFYRADRDRSAPGSGLGLAIVAKAAQDHGGEPWVRETPGGGATVGFTIPN